MHLCAFPLLYPRVDYIQVPSSLVFSQSLYLRILLPRSQCLKFAFVVLDAHFRYLEARYPVFDLQSPVSNFHKSNMMLYEGYRLPLPINFFAWFATSLDFRSMI